MSKTTIYRSFKQGPKCVYIHVSSTVNVHLYSFIFVQKFSFPKVKNVLLKSSAENFWPFYFLVLKSSLIEFVIE